MEPFAPGDRVVAINTDMSAPIYPNGDRSQHPFQFPDGPLRRGVIFHVANVKSLPCGRLGVFLTGMRVIWGSQDIPWHSSRFRKVDVLHEHSPKHSRRKKPVSAHSAKIGMAWQPCRAHMSKLL